MRQPGGEAGARFGYPGSITEASQVIRVLPTGSLRHPGLHEVADALGLEKSGAGPAAPPACSRA